MSTKNKLSPIQIGTLRHIDENGGKAYRFAGGKWSTHADILPAYRDRLGSRYEHTARVGWYAATQTITSLTRRGLLEVVAADDLAAAEWARPREITALGRATLEALREVASEEFTTSAARRVDEDSIAPGLDFDRLDLETIDVTDLYVVASDGKATHLERVGNEWHTVDGEGPVTLRVRPAPTPGPDDFKGSDYIADFDYKRLKGQMRRVWDYMTSHGWATLDDIAQATGDPHASISAQLRHLRKPEFGAHKVEKRRYLGLEPETGLFEYRLQVNKNTRFDNESDAV